MSTKQPSYLVALDQLRNELTPLNYIEIHQNDLVLGSSRGYTALNHSDISKLIIALTAIQRELQERQVL